MFGVGPREDEGARRGEGEADKIQSREGEGDGDGRKGAYKRGPYLGCPHSI